MGGQILESRRKKSGKVQGKYKKIQGKCKKRLSNQIEYDTMRLTA